MPLKPLSTKQFVVTMSSSAGTSGGILFNKCTAPETTYGTFEAADPSAGTIETYTEFAKCNNVTLTKFFEGENDALYTWYDSYKTAVPRPEMSVTIQPVLPDTAGTPYPGSRTIQLLRCKVVKIQHAPAIDRDGNGGGMVELELAVGEVK